MWKYRVYMESDTKEQDLRIFSRGLHRMLINWFDSQNHQFTEEIKSSNSLRPFSVSFLRKDTESRLFYTDISITDEKGPLGKYLKDALELSTNKNEEIDLNYQKFKIKSSKLLIQKTYFELLEIARQKKDLNKIKIDFLSETIFNYKLKDQPKSLVYCLPDRELIFDSLINRWNSFCISRFDPDELKEFVLKNLQIIETNIRTDYFSLGYADKKPIRTQGFKGSIILENISKDEAWDNIVKGLLLYGSWSGVGKKTAFGMGQIKIGFFS